MIFSLTDDKIITLVIRPNITQPLIVTIQDIDTFKRKSTFFEKNPVIRKGVLVYPWFSPDVTPMSGG